MENASSSNFGNANGVPVKIFTLKNAAGFSAPLSELGATWVSWLVPEKSGAFSDVILGFANAENYLKQKAYAGAICGRVANRIANAKFSLLGNEFSLPQNDGKNCLHGGENGFNSKIWAAEIRGNDEEPAVEFSRISPDGEEGFPGNLKIKVTYTLCKDGAVKINYEATSDKATPINLTNHAYFNLAGEAAGTTILNHWLKISADKFLPTDETAIPTGEVWNVKGLPPFNFKVFHKIGERIAPENALQLAQAKGYDHAFIVAGTPNSLRHAATLFCEESGRILDVETTEPAIQVYSGNFLGDACAGTPSKSGALYGDFSGIALETQHVPDAINQPHFSANVLVPAAVYRSETIYRISLKQ